MLYEYDEPELLDIEKQEKIAQFYNAIKSCQEEISRIKKDMEEISYILEYKDYGTIQEREDLMRTYNALTDELEEYQEQIFDLQSELSECSYYVG